MYSSSGSVASFGAFLFFVHFTLSSKIKVVSSLSSSSSDNTSQSKANVVSILGICNLLSTVILKFSSGVKQVGVGEGGEKGVGEGCGDEGGTYTVCRWIRLVDKRVGGTRGCVVKGRNPVEELMQGLRLSTVIVYRPLWLTKLLHNYHKN